MQKEKKNRITNKNAKKGQKTSKPINTVESEQRGHWGMMNLYEIKQ